MVANFAKVKMEVLPRHAAVGVQPILGIAPEAFDAVDVVAPDRPPPLFSDHHVLAAPLLINRAIVK